MKQCLLEVTKNECLTSDIYEMTLEGETGENRAGQFANVSVPNKFLRRPISVADAGENFITLVYRVTGEGTGTDEMSKLSAGDTLDVLTGLGNGYDTSLAGCRPLLLGGGVGTPPIYCLAKTLVSAGISPIVALGFNRADDMFYLDKFKALGVELRVATLDGSYGDEGFVTDAAFGIDFSYYYACGPMPMLAAIRRAYGERGEMSFEERMGCGFGACVGCTWNTKSGARRVCRDGPVFKTGEIIWKY
ncbi:MAG: dihydroorotate dehydrogenase electron transfer subunit [Clostridia bacterium]|nr:dihydroorotate dehydrogenase electron transfer subunit [Clostridia bacterium]